jgi:hypothetical protein
LNLNYGQNNINNPFLLPTLPNPANYFVATYDGFGSYAMKVPVIKGHKYNRQILYKGPNTVEYTLKDLTNGANDTFSLNVGNESGNFNRGRHSTSTFIEAQQGLNRTQGPIIGPYTKQADNLQNIDGNNHTPLNVTSGGLATRNPSGNAAVNFKDTPING